MEENKFNVISTTCGSPLIRQLYICSGEIILHLYSGLIFGAPTVFIPQIRKQANSSDIITLEMESWLSMTITSYSSIPWTVILPIMSYYWGRRVPAIILWLMTLISTFVLYFSTTIMEIIISQILLGILPAAVVTVSIMIFTEYTSPKYRGIFLTLKVATFFWGIWISNVIGTYFNWKYIVIAMFICCVLSSTIFFWPESPFWLASKGRFDECAKTHRWLNGYDELSEKELSSLIELHKAKLKKGYQNNSIIAEFSKYLKIIKMKTFYKPIVFTVLTSLLYILSCKLACSVYTISILKKITASEDAAYIGMITLDGFNVFGMYLGCVLSKYFNRRTVLMLTSLVEVALLFILSFYLYLIKCSIIDVNQYVSIILLTLFSTAVSCGPIILSPCICGELAPIKYRGIYFSVTAIVQSIIMSTSIKLTPFIFEYTEIHVVFLLSGISTSVVIVLVYLYLPETKDKSLPEIYRLLGQNETSSIIKEEEISRFVFNKSSTDTDETRI